MAARSFRINYRVLTAFLLVGLPLLALGIVLVLGMGQAAIRDSYGRHLSQVAEQTAAAVDMYVFRRIVDVSILARVPAIRELASEGTRQALVPAVVRDLDQQWQKQRAAPPALAGVMTNAASRFFADIVRQDPIYREIMLTDRHGRLVAASNLTTDYFQADEDWWRGTYDDGVLGRMSVSDVRWDESARIHAVEISVPVAEPGSDTLAGVLKIAADVREMLALIGGIQLGGTGEAVLIRHNGSVVFSRRPVAPNAKFFATDLLHQRLQRVREGDPAVHIYVQARGSDGKRLVGFGRSQLVSSYPNLAWMVAVSQAEDELLSATKAQAWYLILVLAMIAVAVLGLALWFSMRLAVPIDMDLVEHAKIRRMEEVDV